MLRKRFLMLMMTLSILSLGLLVYMPTIEAAQKTLGNLLLELESNIKWEAVTDNWKKRRDGWVKECQSAIQPVEVANLLLELEENIQWKAVEDKWKTRRDGWISAVKNAESLQQVAKLLLELETNIRWSAVEAKWKQRRDGWIKDVASIR